MASQSAASGSVRFADFQLDLRSGELRRDGALVKLAVQPSRILVLLVLHAGEIVPRQEIFKHVWNSETFVDYEQGLSFGIRQIRIALEDDAEHPRFIETLPKRGYRFIARLSVETRDVELPPAPIAPPLEISDRKGKRWFGLVFAIAAGLLLAAVAISQREFLLRHLPGTARPHPIKSLAVLPLRNLSPDPDQQYFSDGMTDELVTALAKSTDLRVISHTSVERYRDTQRSLPDVAKELGVDAVVEGTVMRSGDRVRITAQLIDARSDQHLWADSYERNLQDILALQGEIAQRIAREVGTSLAATRQLYPGEKRSVDPVAYEAYLKGNFYLDHLTCSDFSKSAAYFEQAVAKDSSFASAYAGLAQSDYWLADWNCAPGNELIAKSKAAGQKAVQLDPNLGAAHDWLGALALFHDQNWETAETELRQAIAIDARDVRARTVYAVYLECMGKRDEGLAEMHRALELDPTSDLTNGVAIYVFYLAHEFDQAIDQAQRTLDFYPDSPASFIYMAASYEMKGMDKQAVSAYLKSKATWNSGSDKFETNANGYGESGLQGYWRHELAVAVASGADSCAIGAIYLHLREPGKAMEYLYRGRQGHCESTALKADPLYDSLHDDPRFKELLAGLRL